MLLRSSLALVFVGILSWAVGASAQDDPGVVGEVATLEGTVEIGRDGAWAPAAAGSDIRSGDQIRTGTPGRVRLVFKDDSVLTVGDGSLLKIDMSVFPPTAGPMRFVLNLIVGKVRALVSEYYRDPLASYQIETATAVSAVRSTEFVVAYDKTSQLTEVLGLGGVVEVHSVKDRTGHGVNITRLTMTKVAKGQYPTTPEKVTVDDPVYQRLMSGIDFVARGVPESLARRDPVLKTTPDTGGETGDATGGPTGGETRDAWKDTAPPVDLGRPGADRTPGEIIDQPTPALSGGSGGAEVEF